MESSIKQDLGPLPPLRAYLPWELKYEQAHNFVISFATIYGSKTEYR